jgi:methylmalonyl-CoA mutase C-terminal domain/subunit
MMPPVRVLLAEFGDGRDGSAATVARALRAAGLDVVHVGRQDEPVAVALAALQEDVDLLAVQAPGEASDVLSAIRGVLAVRGAGDTLVLAIGSSGGDEAALRTGRNDPAQLQDALAESMVERLARIVQARGAR